MMPFISIPEHFPVTPPETCEYLKAGNCYWCCWSCNVNQHTCPGCGEDLDHLGRESNGKPHEGCTG